MDMRRLALLLLLVLLPVPAQAHKHKMEASAGLSTGSITGRFSVAGRLWPSPFDGTGAAANQSLFVFVEGAVGGDSGHTLDDWMIGLRFRLADQRSIQPFVHGMVGRRSPPRPDGVDAATVTSTAAAVGGGVDYALNPQKDFGLMWLVRFQGDAVGSWPSSGFDSHLRATVGLALRWEGRH
jgi:hypothetical protein